MTAAHPPLGVAVIGCGNISTQYLRQLTAFPDLQVLFCADLDPARAAAQAKAFDVPGSGLPAEALAHPGVELVVNLTIPAAHAEVAHTALSAGKHVWNEKPLTDDLDAAHALLQHAEDAGLRIGCAPDTLLGPGFQTAARLIADGAIGTPLTALALLQGPGPDRWHPDPAFLFARGAGPLFDMGPYYLSALAWLFGPATRTAAVGRRAQPVRTVKSGPLAGTSFPVETPSQVSALLEYRDGPAATVLFSCDSPLERSGFLEVTGTEATLALPDPNHFDGEIRLRRAGDAEWTVVPTVGTGTGRGAGVLELARALREDRPHRASGELALHVLETMTAIERSAATGAFQQIHSAFPAPAPLPADWSPNTRSTQRS